MERPRRTALIVGASSPGGLGDSVARRLDKDGFGVILAGRRPEALSSLAQDIGAQVVRCDMLDEESIAAAVAAAGSFDVLINAAGTTLGQSILNLRREQIEAQFAVHVTGNLLLLKHAVPVMPDGGCVVLFSSILSTRPGQGLAAYGSAKAALDQVVRIAALEFGPRGIRVNAVAPGFSLTPMTESFLAQPRLAALYERETALGALTAPHQVAATVAHLVAEDCFITGEILQVSGGAPLCRLPRKDELKG